MNKQDGYGGVIEALIVIALIVFGIWFGIWHYNTWVQNTEATVTFTVKEKGRVTDNDRDGRYLIYTSDEVFENTDSWHHQKYDSSDLYGNLEVGKKYECLVYGERIPRYSWYRNLVNCTEIK